MKSSKISADHKKAFKTYSDEIRNDLGILRKGINQNSIEKIKSASYGLKMTADWLISLVEKYK